MDIFSLIDACCEVYDNPDFIPRNGVTYCNQAVQSIAEKVGCYGFAVTMNANEMIDLMKASPTWQKIQIGEAQNQANQGKLVIACKRDNPHGHVVVIRPGRCEWSSKWNCMVPKVVNIGETNFIGKGVNWVFPEMPDFYVLT